MQSTNTTEQSKSSIVARGAEHDPLIRATALLLSAPAFAESVNVKYRGPVDLAFTAAENDLALQVLARGDHTAMAQEINRQVVAQARQYVWGLNDGASNFVRKHISTLPSRPIISAEAGELAHKQARGEA